MTNHIDLQIHCGCGGSFVSITEAVAHANTRGHSLTIQGTIRPATEAQTPGQGKK